jgi:hypothetical protein
MSARFDRALRYFPFMVSSLPVFRFPRLAVRCVRDRMLRAACVIALAAAGAAAAQDGAGAADTSQPAAVTSAAAPDASEAPLFRDGTGWGAPEPCRTDRMQVLFSYYTWHFHPDPRHQHAYLGDFNYRFDRYWFGGQWLAGFALFNNSFGQFSQYAYGGLLWRLWEEHPQAYVKLTGGIVHGYSGEFRDKIPFNHYGVAPAIIPSVGYCWTRYCTEAVLLGANAMLFTVGMTIP